jgi:hypothetical protein
MPGLFLQIERQRTLVAVKIQHVGTITGSAHAFVGVDAGRRFDLDHVCAEVAQDPATRWPGARASKIEDTQICQCGRRA